MAQWVLFMKLAIVLCLLEGVNFLEPLFDHPEIFRVLHINLDLAED